VIEPHEHYPFRGALARLVPKPLFLRERLDIWRFAIAPARGVKRGVSVDFLVGLRRALFNGRGDIVEADNASEHVMNDIANHVIPDVARKLMGDGGIHGGKNFFRGNDSSAEDRRPSPGGLDPLGCEPLDLG
jgi:hypothetical protein